MVGSPRQTKGPGLELPDLELQRPKPAAERQPAHGVPHGQAAPPAHASKAGPGRPATTSRAAQAGPFASGGFELGDGQAQFDPQSVFSTYGGGNLDFDDFGDSYSSDSELEPLSVETGGPGLTPNPGSVSAGRGKLPSGTNEQNRGARRAQQTAIQALQPRELPSGTTPELQDLPIDPVDIIIAAEFGEPPKHWLLSPFYAWKTLLRRREIQEEIRLAGQRLRSYEHQRDESLADFVIQLRGEIEKDPSCERLLVEVKQQEESAGQKNNVLHQVKAEYQAKCAALDQQDVDLQIEIAGLREQSTRRGKLVNHAGQEASRYSARLQRTQIQQRNLQQQLQMAPPGSDTSAIQIELNNFSELEKIHAGQAQQKLQKLEAEQGLQNRVLQQIQGIEDSRQQLIVQRKELDQAFKQQSELRSDSVLTAEVGVRRALAEAGRKLLLQPGRVTIQEAHVVGLREQAARVLEAATQLELWNRAYHSHHHAMYRTGGRLIVATIVTLLALCILKIAWPTSH